MEIKKENWEKELRPWVSKPNREEEEGIYQIKKTIIDEIWAKQKPKIRQLLKFEKEAQKQEMVEIIEKIQKEWRPIFEQNPDNREENERARFYIKTICNHLKQKLNK